MSYLDEEIKISDEFKKNLKENVIREVNRRKKKKLILKQIMVAICCLLIVVSGGVFAGDIGSFMAKMFSNVNKGIEIAISNNYIQKIEMDYIEHSGIYIKPEYILVDDNNFNIAFNIKTDMEFDEIFFDEIIIKDENGDAIYDNSYETGGEILNLMFRSIDIRDKMLSNKEMEKTYMLDIMGIEYNEFEEIYIYINDVHIIKDNEINSIEENWSFKIDSDKNIFNRNDLRCAISETELLNNYNVKLTNTGLNIQLDFKDDEYLKNILNKKEKILIEDKNGKIYNCNDFIFDESDKLKLSFPITKFDEIDEFNLKIYLDKEILNFNIKTKRKIKTII